MLQLGGASSGASSVDDATVTVELAKTSAGFGLKFGGPKNEAEADKTGPGLFISGTKPDSAAARHPDVKDGLQIVSLNGQDLTDGNFGTLKAALQGVDTLLTLKLRENPALAASYATVRPSGRRVLQLGGASSGASSADEAVAPFQDPEETSTEDGPSDRRVLQLGGASRGTSSADGAVAPFQYPEETSTAEDEAELADMGDILDMLDVEDTSTMAVDEVEHLQHTAFIIVDVQNDFISGSLMVGDAETIVPKINALRSTVPFGLVCLSQNSHPADHCSFVDNYEGAIPFSHRDIAAPDGSANTVVQVMWPRHCVEGTLGWEFHPDLVTLDTDSIQATGTDSKVDSYSAFFDNWKGASTGLAKVLEEREITDVFVVGLATDLCAGLTACDAAHLGFNTFLVEDCALGVSPDSIAAMKVNLAKAGVRLIGSTEVLDLAVYGHRKARASLSAGMPLVTPIRKTKSAERHNCHMDDGVDRRVSSHYRRLSGTMSTGTAFAEDVARATTLTPTPAPAVVDALHTSVTLAKGPSGYGLVFGGPKTAAEAATTGFGIVITAIKPGSIAEDAPGICAGVQILSMNGTDLAGGTFEDLKRALQADTSRLELVVRANRELAARWCKPPAGKPPAGTITIKKGPGGFGLKFGGAKNLTDTQAHGAGIFVAGTKPGSAAAAIPAIKDGFQIVMLNGEDISIGTFADIKRLTAGKDELTLLLKPNPALVTAYKKLEELSMTGRGASFGVGGSPGGDAILDPPNPTLMIVFRLVNAPSDMLLPKTNDGFVLSEEQKNEKFAVDGLQDELDNCIAGLDPLTPMLVAPHDIMERVWADAEGLVPVAEILRAGTLATGQPHKAAEIEIKVSRPSSEISFGVTLGISRGRHCVTEIAEDGPSAGVLFKGDVVIEVNGMAAGSWEHDAVTEMLSMGGLELFLKVETTGVNRRLSAVRTSHSIRKQKLAKDVAYVDLAACLRTRTWFYPVFVAVNHVEGSPRIAAHLTDHQLRPLAQMSLPASLARPMIGLFTSASVFRLEMRGRPAASPSPSPRSPASRLPPSHEQHARAGRKRPGRPRSGVPSWSFRTALRISCSTSQTY